MSEGRTKCEEGFKESDIHLSNRSDNSKSENGYLATYRGQKMLMQKSETKFQQAGMQGDSDDHQFYIDIHDASINKGLLSIQQEMNERIRSNSYLNDLTFNNSQIHQVISIPIQSRDLNDLSKTEDPEQNIKVKQQNDYNTDKPALKSQPSQNIEVQQNSKKISNVDAQKVKVADGECDIKDLIKINKKLEIPFIEQESIKPLVSQQYRSLTIHKFIIKLKERLLWQKKPDHLTQKHYQLINDRSSSNYYSLSQDDLFNIKRVSDIVNLSTFRIPIILPHHYFSLIWDCFILIFSSFFLFTYSILLFFGQNIQNKKSYNNYFITVIILFGCDILFNFHRAYFQKEMLITNLNKIAKNYIKSLFFFDAFSFSIIIYRYSTTNSSLTYNPNHNILDYFINSLIFLKAFSLPSKISKVLNIVNLSNNQKHLLRLLNQILILILSAHVIGYGDVTPSNAIECLFITVCVVIMSCIFAFSINNIGIILNEIEKDSKELNENLQTMHTFLKSKGIDGDLIARVKNYLVFQSKENKKRNKDAENKIINILPNILKNELIKEINQKILNNYSIFAKNFSSKVNNELVFALQEILVPPNQIIFSENEFEEDQSMYFVASGSIEIFTTYLTKQKKQQSIVLSTLGTNQFFGEISFFTGQARSANARSVNQVALYKLTRKDFLSILQNHQDDYERYKMIEQQIILQKDLSILQTACYSCQKSGHFIKECPYIHRSFDNQSIILKNNFSYFQHRNKRQILSRLLSKQISKKADVKKDTKPLINSGQVSQVRKKQNSKLIKNHIAITAQNFKQQAANMGSAIQQYFNDINQIQYEEDDHQIINHEIINSENNLTSNSDSSVKHLNKNIISKSGTKETDIIEVVDQPNNIRKRDIYFQKTGEEDMPFSQIEAIVSTLQAMSQNSKKDLSHEQLNQTYSQQTIKSQVQNTEGLQSQQNNQKKLCIQVNNKETLANITSKMAISKTDNTIQQSFDIPAEREQYTQQLSDIYKVLFPHTINSNNLIQPINSHSFDSNQQQQRISKLSNQIKNLYTPSSNKTTYQEIDTSFKNLQLYDIIFNKKPILIEKDLQELKQYKMEDVKDIFQQFGDFDRMKIFKRFYPNHNFDKVLKAIKAINSEKQRQMIQQSFAQKKRRHQNQLSRDSNILNKGITHSYKATSCSYGIFTKYGQLYPINNYKEE